MRNKKTDDDYRREHDARVAEGELLAQALVGRSEKAALRRARKDGFKPEVLPIGESSWLQGDWNLNRIRLFVDENHRVVRASAG